MNLSLPTNLWSNGEQRLCRTIRSFQDGCSCGKCFAVSSFQQSGQLLRHEGPPHKNTTDWVRRAVIQAILWGFFMSSLLPYVPMTSVSSSPVCCRNWSEYPAWWPLEYMQHQCSCLRKHSIHHHHRQDCVGNAGWLFFLFVVSLNWSLKTLLDFLKTGWILDFLYFDLTLKMCLYCSFKQKGNYTFLT